MSDEESPRDSKAKSTSESDASSSSAASSTPATEEAPTIDQLHKDLKELTALVKELSRQQAASGQSVQASGTEPGKLTLNIKAEVDFHSGDVAGGWRPVSTSAGADTDGGSTDAPGGGEATTRPPTP